MNRVALQMLTGDSSKYLSLIFSISFATLLMTQQVSIFMGIVTRTGNQILDVRDASIWVMDPKTRFIDEAPALRTTEIDRVRGVKGVDWAVKFYKGQVRARTETGEFRNVILLGVDDDSLVGTAREMALGRPEDLQLTDSVFIDKAGFEYMWPGEPLSLGREFQMNDRRVVLRGITKTLPPFTTLPVIHARYSLAEELIPGERNMLTFILAEPKPGADLHEVCRQIEKETGLLALTRDQFFWKTIAYTLSSTGIPINFGITIALGFIVGVTVAGQTFYLFTIENLRQFGSLKAMGMSNLRIVGMILLQATVVGVIGYSIGMGLTAGFFAYTNRLTHLAGIHMTSLAAVLVGVAVLLIIVLASLLSIRRVIVLEPAEVFRG
jgi:putative ABC transport system permease protein